MVQVRIQVVDPPAQWECEGEIKLVLQTKSGYEEAGEDGFLVELGRKPDRSGAEQWFGPAVHHHGDGRRFVYLAWLGRKDGSDWKMFRRIKLYLSQIEERLSGSKNGTDVRIAGKAKDGSPACSTAQLLP